MSLLDFAFRIVLSVVIFSKICLSFTISNTLLQIPSIALMWHNAILSDVSFSWKALNFVPSSYDQNNSYITLLAIGLSAPSDEKS
jgi:hypothetical protein